MSKLSNVIHGQCQPGHELKDLGGAMRRTAEQKAGHQEGAMDSPAHEKKESKSFERNETGE